MLAISGEYVWNVRSTPSPLEILRTTNDELRPRLRLAITTPSYACTRLRSPSTTFTLTMTVSPGANAGIVLPRRAISSCSSFAMMSTSFLRFADQRSAHRHSSARSLRLPVTHCLLPEFGQQRRLFLRERPLREQIRPPLRRPAERHLQPPAPDCRVVARQQHVGHAATRILFRPCVMRAVEKPVDERLLRGRVGVVQHTRPLAHDRIDQHQRRQFSARDDKIANRDLLVHFAREQPLVDSLVASGEQHVTRRVGCLRERGSLRDLLRASR